MLITIYGKELKTKDNKKFIKYSYTKDGKSFYNVKVAQASPVQLANKTGYLKISFELDKCFIKHGKVLENGFKENDTLWIMELLQVAVDTEARIKADEKRAKALQDLF